MIVYLDLDGVVTQFCEGVFKLFGRDPVELKKWPKGVTDIETVLGVSKSEFWKTVDSDATFWENLEPYPHTAELIDALKGYTVHILTSPAQSPMCAYGKTLWVQRHLPHLAGNLIITRNKYLLARKNSILIDDMQKNIDSFRDAGGLGLLFPAYWNDNAHMAKHSISYVKGYLDQIKQIYMHQ